MVTGCLGKFIAMGPPPSAPSPMMPKILISALFVVFGGSPGPPRVCLQHQYSITIFLRRWVFHSLSFSPSPFPPPGPPPPNLGEVGLFPDSPRRIARRIILSVAPGSKERPGTQFSGIFDNLASARRACTAILRIASTRLQSRSGQTPYDSPTHRIGGRETRSLRSPGWVATHVPRQDRQCFVTTARIMMFSCGPGS